MSVNELLERDGIKVAPTDTQLEGYKKEMAELGFALAWKRYTNDNISYQSNRLGQPCPFGKGPHQMGPSFGTPC